MIKAGKSVRRAGIDRTLLARNLIHNLKSYGSSAFLIWLAVFFYRYDPYYDNFLGNKTQLTILWMALAYTVLGFLFYAFTSIRKAQDSRGLVIIRALNRLSREYSVYLKKFPTRARYPLPKPTERERVAIFFAVVKLFFLPLMLNFLFDNYSGIVSALDAVRAGGPLLSMAAFNSLIFPLLLSLFLLIDTAIFTFGYVVESKILGSSVRSVDPTFLGWGVALISYPPFNNVVGNYSNWYANDYAYFSSEKVTFFVRIILLLLMGFYASASVALGPKASNLTNRGIVGWGPYRLLRHPAYISKNLFWWITVLPVMGIAAALSMGVWSFIYFLRAITEERHLSADPDYRKYCQKVRYRFVPGLW